MPKSYFSSTSLSLKPSLVGVAVQVLLSAPLLAQVIPSTPLQQGAPQPQSAPHQSSVGVVTGPADTPRVAPGGAKVSLKAINLTGNTSFDADTLLAVLQFEVGTEFDYAGMNDLARKLGDFYHRQGYPFASAFLPQQKLQDGVLQIEVVEGRYGKLSTSGEFLPEEADPFLAALRPGDPIEAKLLERTMLIIDDLPMIDVSPNVRPGVAYGTGDLDAHVTRLASYGGEVGVDNVGNRFTGQNRVRLGLNLISVMRFGDEIRLKAIKSSGGMLLGSADYEAPLNGYGLRGQVGYARTTYQLGQDYSYLNARGFADVYSARVGYPVVRSQARNLSFNLGWLYKNLQDRIDLNNTINNKHSTALPVTVLFDARDSFAGGGLTYGNLVWTSGKMALDPNQMAADQATARTNGDFHKTTFEVTRIQTLPMDFSLFARYATQWPSHNLDSSEKFSTGGIYGVRAYPTGQGVGDKGWLMQTELRQKFGDLTGFFLYDVGVSRINQQPWDSSLNNYERISGAGFGLRLEQLLGWNFEAMIASRITQVMPSDNSRTGPRMLVSATYRY